MSRRVLLVEDEMLIAMDIKAILEEAGFEVVGPAACIEQALALLARHDVDGAVLDVSLDRGIDPVARLLTERKLPFLFISGVKRDHLSPGLRGRPFVEKPFQPQQLAAELAALFGAPARAQSAIGP